MEGTLRALSGQYPVLTVTGPRQSGKTTLVRQVFRDHAYANLEVPDLRLLAARDPRSFFVAYPPPLIIDEFQRVPELLSYLQADVDEHRGEGARYVLTGSQSLSLMAQVTQSLAGRTALLQLLPLSLRELGWAGIRLDRDEAVFEGFMPWVHRRDADLGSVDRSMFYSNYFRTYIERDLRQLASIRHLDAFETFLRLLAGRVGQLVNLQDLAGAVGMSSTTLAEWLSVLEASFVIFRLRPYFRNMGKRLVKSPKLYFTEPGLAAYLLGIREAAQVGTHPQLGGLFENVVVAEFLKNRLNRGLEPDLYFFRDSRGLEADLVVETPRGVLPIEIKASRTYSPDFFASIDVLRRKLPGFLPGLVVYAGELESQSGGNRLVSFRDVGGAVDGV
jgi:predicted AAA+ superfamily ATPase